MTFGADEPSIGLRTLRFFLVLLFRFRLFFRDEVTPTVIAERGSILIFHVTFHAD
jgi:hypothetical protein